MFNVYQGWSGNALPHLFALVTFLENLDYIKTWLRSYRCASDTQIRTASQNSKLKQADPLSHHFIRTIWCNLVV